MVLPKQVQAQAKASDDYDTQVRGANAPIEPPGDEPPVVDPPEPTLDPVAQEPKPQVTPPKATADDSALWKQRFQSLQGMYNSMVPGLQSQVKELTATVKTLTEQIAASKAPPAADGKKPRLVTPDDEKTFGADLVDLARRVSRDEFGEREAGYREEINQLRQALEAANGEVGEIKATSVASARDVFFERLTAKVPKWDELQQTDECQAFLDSRVPGTRHKWDDALKAAASDMDVDAAAEVFQVFLQQNPQHAPAKPPAKPARQNELERQVAPARSSNLSPTASTQKRIYSSEQYAAESMRQLRLMQHGKNAEALALESELNLALAEGRIRG
jgi:hypothetical protein